MSHVSKLNLAYEQLKGLKREREPNKSDFDALFYVKIIKENLENLDFACS